MGGIGGGLGDTNDLAGASINAAVVMMVLWVFCLSQKNGCIWV